MSQEYASTSLPSVEVEGALPSLVLRSWLSLALVIPLLLFPLHVIVSPGIQGVFASILQFFCATPFYMQAFTKLKQKKLCPELLISLSITCGYVLGFYFLFSQPHRGIYFEVSSFLVVAALWQKRLLQACQRRARSSLEELSGMQPSIVRLMREGRLIEISSDEVKGGEICVVYPGEVIALDAVIEEGTSRVDESILTGDGMAVEKNIGSFLFAGTRNGYGLLKARVVAMPSQTTLKQVVSLVERAQRIPPKSLLQAKKTRHYVTLFGLCSALGIWMGQALFMRGPLEGVISAIAALATLSPYAFEASLSFILLLSSTQAARRGALLTSSAQFEQMARMKTLIIEASSVTMLGDLALDKMELDREYLPLIKALCLQFDHPLSEKLLTWMRDEQVPSIQSMLIGFRLYPGEGGVSGYFDGRKYFLGTVEFLEEHQVPVEKIRVKDQVILGFGLEKLFLGHFSFAQQIKAKTFQAMEELKRMKVKTVLTTIDPLISVTLLAKRLKPDEIDMGKKGCIGVFDPRTTGRVIEGNLLPLWRGADPLGVKQEEIIFTISYAGQSIELQEGTIALMHADLLAVAKEISFSREVSKKIAQNKLFALAFSGLGIALALSGYIHPLAAVVWGTLVPLCLTLNAISIEKKKNIQNT